jgi:hypothetical protein
MLVKNADLPKFQIQTETINQYNRKAIIQKNIQYQTVSLVMHDDAANTVHNLWTNYFKYYYSDPNLSGSSNQNTFIGTAKDSKSGAYGDTKYDPSDNLYIHTDYGLNNRGVNKPFFRSITLYQLSRQQFTSFQLVNPKIKSWDHDRLDQSQGNKLLESKMSIDYETVFYGSGRVRKDNPTGFAVLHSDTSPSPLGVNPTKNGIENDIIAGATEIFGNALGIFPGDKRSSSDVLNSVLSDIGSNLLRDALGTPKDAVGTNGYSIKNDIIGTVANKALNGLGLDLNLNLGRNIRTS